MQEYDNIIKENLQEILPKVFSVILGIKDAMKAIPIELAKTISRKPDLLFEVSSKIPYLLQVEFQSKNDAKMHSRMFLYAGLLFEKHQVPIKQVVIYLGKSGMNMKSSIPMPDYTFHYDLINLYDYPYRFFLQTNEPEAIIFAVLGNFGQEQTSKVLGKILAQLKKNVKNENELKKYAMQLQTLSNLRTFANVSLKYLLDMIPTLNIEKDPIYKKGIEKGIEKGVEKGIEKERISMIKKMYENGMTLDSICKILNLPKIRIKKYLAS
jgi:predicted transposase/invertase (TIGR01784 family)